MVNGRQKPAFLDQRLEAEELRILWHKPAGPAWDGAQRYGRQPEALYIREVMVQLLQRGFPVRSLVVSRLFIFMSQRPWPLGHGQ